MCIPFSINLLHIYMYMFVSCPYSAPSHPILLPPVPPCSIPPSGFTYSAASLSSPAPACRGTSLGPGPVSPLVVPSAGAMLCAYPVPAPPTSADELAAVGSRTAPLPASPSLPSFLSTSPAGLRCVCGMGCNHTGCCRI